VVVDDEVTLTGADGTVVAFTGSEGADGSDVPFTLVAVTVQV
jgi:hypothetical protein